MTNQNLQSLLIEIGTEELPIRAIDELAAAFANGVCKGLGKRLIAADAFATRIFCTPRRLAVFVPTVAEAQPEQKTESLGPYANIALDEQGQPTRALLGFAQKAGVVWTQLERISDAKGERFVHRAVRTGQTTAALLPQIVTEALATLPIPKPMRWGDHDYTFVRPVHWLVMLHGGRVIEGEVLGLKSGRYSRGHRFMHPQPVHLADADSYLDALRAAKVLADPAEREKKIDHELANVIGKLRTETRDTDLSAHIDIDNIAQVKNLTEWPVGIACSFDADYLRVPQEALIQTMQANQRFFPVLDAQSKLTPYFIGIANIESKDPDQIRRGYERVIRPRFADARFFFDEDLRTPLASHQQGLREVTWQKALGSLWNKTVRVAELARTLANRLREQGVEVDAALTTHAAALSRCDLLTRMVGEFPELQGVMGRHYAAAQGERAEVANALNEFYRPRRADDGIAQGALAQALSIADKLDTLAGIFAAGMKPSGNKDPFALRRAALGLARTMIEGGLDLDLRAHLREALEQIPEAAFAAGEKSTSRKNPHHPPTAPRIESGAGSSPASGGKEMGVHRTALIDELHDFIFDRLRGYYAEQGYTPGQFAAVAAVKPASLVDFDRRLRAVAAFAQRPEAANLAAANKRVANILRKEGIDVRTAASCEIDAAALRESAELELWQALQTLETDHSMSAGTPAGSDYEGMLARLAQLQTPVDRFFEEVLVLADDPIVRANRLALLARIKTHFDAIADIALL